MPPTGRGVAGIRRLKGGGAAGAQGTRTKPRPKRVNGVFARWTQEWPGFEGDTLSALGQMRPFDPPPSPSTASESYDTDLCECVRGLYPEIKFYPIPMYAFMLHTSS